MCSKNVTRSVHGIISDIDDSISQAESSSQFSVEIMNDDDDDDATTSSFDEEVLEEEDSTEVNANKVTSIESSYTAKSATHKQHESIFFNNQLQDDMEDDFNQLRILEKDSQQRKKMVDARSTKKVLKELEARSQDFQQRNTQSSVRSMSSSHFDAHLVENEMPLEENVCRESYKAMSFEKSVCSETIDNDFSTSLCDESTITSDIVSVNDSLKNYKLFTEFQMKTPRANNRKGAFVSKLSSFDRQNTPKFGTLNTLSKGTGLSSV